MGSFGSSWGTLGVVLPLFCGLWRPLGNFWGAFGWLWESFGLPWGGFGAPLGSLGDVLGDILDVFGCFWGACGALLGVNNVKKLTFRTYAFYGRKTTYFVGLGGQVGAKMPPRRAKMTQNGRLIPQSWPKEARDGAKRQHMRPRGIRIGTKGGQGCGFRPTLGANNCSGRPAQTCTPGPPRNLFGRSK